MVSALLSRFVILVFGTLYPAYKSYKAVKTKNVKEYVKWMMYWIVFALFTCLETFTDLFVAWLPFYYELKIVFVLWLLSPATKGASILYRKFVHPQLSKREQDIDAQLEKVTDQGYTALVSLGQKGFQYATNVVVTTAIKGQAHITEQLKRSYSTSDVSTDPDRREKRRELEEYSDDEDDTDNRMIQESYETEMQEKHLDAANTPPQRRRKIRASSKEDLEDIDEHGMNDTHRAHKEPTSPRMRRAYYDKTPSSSAPGSPYATPRHLAGMPRGGFHFERYVRSYSSGTAPATAARDSPLSRDSSESSGNTSPVGKSPWKSRGSGSSFD